MRRSGGAAVLALLLVTSGCIGFVTGGKPLTFESGQVEVSQAAQRDTNYDRARAGTQAITRNFSVLGQTRQVKVTNYIAEYDRGVTLPLLGTQELARFTVLATPKVSVLGRTFNPVADFSNRELVQLLQRKYTAIQNVRLVGNRTVTILGEEVRVSKFSARATIQDGQTIDVYLHIAKTETDEDFVIAVAVHPQTLPAEQQAVNRLLGGIEHESEAA